MLDLINQLDTISEWEPPQIPRRRCKHCTAYLRQSNPDDSCSLCYRKAVEADFNRPMIHPTQTEVVISKSGFRNVYKNGSGYAAQIYAEGRKQYVGMYKTAELASIAATKAKEAKRNPSL